MVPWVSNEAEAEIAVECWCADVVLAEDSFYFNVCLGLLI